MVSRGKREMSTAMPAAPPDARDTRKLGSSAAILNYTFTTSISEIILSIDLQKGRNSFYHRQHSANCNHSLENIGEENNIDTYLFLGDIR